MRDIRADHHTLDDLRRTLAAQGAEIAALRQEVAGLRRATRPTQEDGLSRSDSRLDARPMQAIAPGGYTEMMSETYGMTDAHAPDGTEARDTEAGVGRNVRVSPRAEEPSEAGAKRGPRAMSRWDMLRAAFVTSAAALGVTALRTGVAQAANGGPVVLGHSSSTHDANTARNTTEVAFKGTTKAGLAFLVNDSNFAAQSAAWPAALGAWAGKHLPHGLFAYTNSKKKAGKGGIPPSAVAAFSLHGYGGYFSGKLAQVCLEPQTGDHPGTGKAGALFVDANADLWFCKGGTDWYRVV